MDVPPMSMTPLVHTTWKRKRSCHIIDSIHALIPPFRPLPANINANTIEIEKIIMKNVKYIYIYNASYISLKKEDYPSKRIDIRIHQGIQTQPKKKKEK